MLAIIAMVAGLFGAARPAEASIIAMHHEIFADNDGVGDPVPADGIYRDGVAYVQVTTNQSGGYLCRKKMVGTKALPCGTQPQIVPWLLSPTFVPVVSPGSAAPGFYEVDAYSTNPLKKGAVSTAHTDPWYISASGCVAEDCAAQILAQFKNNACALATASAVAIGILTLQVAALATVVFVYGYSTGGLGGAAIMAAGGVGIVGFNAKGLTVASEAYKQWSKVGDCKPLIEGGTPEEPSAINAGEDFTVVVQPVFDPVPSPPSDPVQAAAISAWVDQLAYLRAFDITADRLAAAEAAGDPVAVRNQRAALGQYGTALGNAIDATAAASADVATQLEGSIRDVAPTAQQVDDATATRNRMVVDGFTPAEITQFHSKGFTDAAIATARAELAYSPAYAAAGQLPSEALNAAAGDLGLNGGWASDVGDAFTALAGPDNVVTALDDAVTTPQGEPVTVHMFDNDVAADGAGLFLQAADATSAHGGGLACDPTSCTYYPPNGFAGDDTFTYVVGSETGGSASATVTVTVDAVAPTATDDNAGATADAPVDIDVLGNDVGPPGATFTITAADATSAHGGTVACAPTGPCTFTPNPAFAGFDTFHYTITTEAGLSDTATVTIEITGAPYGDPPLANADNATAKEATVKGLNVLSNDVAPPGMALHLTNYDTATANGGTVSCGSGGNCFYTPHPQFLGIDAFAYEVATTGNKTATAVATITVEPKAGTIKPDSVNATTGEVASFNVLTNDLPPGPTSWLQVVAFDAVSTHGATVGCDGEGNCTYQVAQPFGGDDTFTYTAATAAGTTATSTVTIHVSRPANQKPTAAADGLTTDGPNVLDVLANDSDPDIDPMKVTSTSSPAHGTASCGALGGCLYRPTAGYEGGDSFTYTLADGRGGTAIGTVDITVVAPAAINHLPVPRPDVLGTTEGVEATVNVLTNDTDADLDALTLTEASAPQHGIVGCTAEGACTYTPEAGFGGFDAFTYVVVDALGAGAVGVVLVRVAPAGTALQPTVTGHDAGGGSGPVAPDAKADWTVRGLLEPPSTPQELAANALPATIQLTLTGDHAIDPASMKLAPGWTFDAATRQLRVASSALAGSSVVDLLAAPAAPVSQGGGGDGHVPILVGNKMFAFFHHSDPTAVTCIDRAANQVCPGYPKAVPLASGMVPGPAAVVGTKLYVHLFPATSSAQSGAISLFCWDAATDATCGLTIVDRYLTTGIPDASAPVVVGDKILQAGDTGKVYCVVAATMVPCAVPSVASGLGVAFDANYDIVTHGTLVYVSRSDTSQLSCVDAATMTLCAGWSTGGRSFGAGWDLITRHDASGAATGICLANGELICADDGSPDARTTYAGWPGVEFALTATEEAEVGTRTFFGLHYNIAGLGCWDWKTNAACTGGQFDGGNLYVDINGNGLPPAYGAAWDGTCIVAVGDWGQAFTVDPRGSSPCSPLQVGASRVVDLRDQRWDHTVGGATWDKVEVRDAQLAAAGDFQSLIITVKDAGTGTVLRTQELVGTNGTIDLAGISAAAHPALTVTGSTVSSIGAPAWADGDPPKLVLSWHPDAAQATFTTTTITCASGQPIGVTASLVGGTATSTKTLTAAAGACGPTAKPIFADVIPGGTTTVTMDGSSPTNKPLTYIITTPPVHGTLGVVSGKTVTYTADAGYSGTDTFLYKVNDGSLDSNTINVTMTVAATVPGPPVQVSAIGGDANAKVRWLPPLSDGGSPITAYDITATPGGKVVTVTADKREVTVTGLVNDTTYTFKVRAKNAKGFGPSSAATNETKPRSACATNAFLDVTKAHPFCPEITWMADHGIANGYSDNNYRPDANVTRQAMAAFVYRLAGSKNGPKPTCAVKPFPDVPITHAFCGEIAWLKAEGISTGFPDGTYKPSAVISRQAMAAFLYRLSESPRGAKPTCDLVVFTDVPVDHQFCGEIDWMVDSGLASGFTDGSFKPAVAISRQAMAAFLFRYDVLTGIVGS